MSSTRPGGSKTDRCRLAGRLLDTKFIDKHKRVLTELLDLQLDPARIDAAAPDFEGRYGFRRKPDYVRLRTAVAGAPYTELTVRADELAAPPPGVTHAYIIENEITSSPSRWSRTRS